MHKMNFFYYVRRFLPPVILIFLGLILVFSPDSATSLLISIFGWGLITAAGLFAAAALFVPGGTASKILGALICGAAGIWMVTHPLALAAWLGRIIGILLLIQGIQNIVYQRTVMGSLFLPILTAVVGTVLLVLPMTTSRLVFIIAGVIVLIIGAVMLFDRFHHPEGLNGPEDPNIIDAL